MAAIALVLLTTEPGREQDVVNELSEMSEIEEAMVLFGEYDVYCKVVVDDFHNYRTSFYETFVPYQVLLKQQP